MCPLRAISGLSSFSNVYYMPLENTVAVEILTRLGDRVSMASGAEHSILVVHFRKRVK